MPNRNSFSRQFGFFCLVLFAVLPVSGSLRAQSGTNPEPAATNPQPAFGAPTSTPAAPVGATFNGSPEETLVSTQTSGAPEVGPNYRIGADDILNINVWHEPEVTRTVPVRPDGMISLPLVGDVLALGLTPAELQTRLVARLSKFLTSPAVSVIVAEIRSQRFNVLGQVLRPGTYPLIPPMSVIDAIADAGGLKEFAKPNKIYILRTLANGQRTRIRIQYKNVLKGKPGSNDVQLQTRDTVVVP